ncbi:MAG: histidine triad nucleotide-binding protein [Actinomycetota bacterium]
MTASDCLFCKIAGGEMDAEVVHETDGVLAFRDINPAAPSHVLVIPKRHVASARELGRGDGDLVAELFEALAVVAEAERLSSGYRIVTNVGPDAGQSVPHLHLHLLGGRTLHWPPG